MPEQTEQKTTKSSSGKNVAAVVITIIILCIIGFLVWWFGFNGNNNNNGNTKTSSSQMNQPDTAAQEAAVKANWTKFFDGKTPAAQKAELLQNGQQFAPLIDEQDQSKTAEATTAKVTKVAINGSTATVTYTVYINGSPALQNQQGQAVLVNGTWKVSDAAFCGLLEMSGVTPPNCPKPAGSSNSQPSTSTPSQTTTKSSGSTTTPSAKPAQ